ncbi:MAG: aspartate aminotransferase family protein [Ilumatobacteraceae bacterium]
MTAHSFLGSPQVRDLPGDHCPFLPVFGPPAVMFVRGEGTQLWDVNGKRYLDFLSGIAVTSLGHAHPGVARALADQAHTMLHVSNFFANPVAARAAVMIDELLGGGGQVFFCNSGAEANEAAIKLARKFGGRSRHRVVSMLGSFHGRTLAALAATGQPAKHEPFQPMPEGFSHVPYGDLGALERAVDGTVAAVLLECVQGEGGVLVADDDYLRGVRQLCTERGALLIVDEVQTGFARTGSWFAFEHSGIAPDAVTLAKAMGNGVPVGALWARRDVGSVFVPGDHGSTYSGTALATAAVIAVIEAMREIDAPRRAREMGATLAGELRRIPQVVDVRGRGLLLAVELGASRDAKAIVGELLERGLVANAVTASAIRLAPPLTVSRGEIDEAVAMIAGVLQ